MEGLLALGITAIGGKMFDKVSDVCTSASSTATTTSTTSFDSVLKTATTKTDNKYASMDADTLSDTIKELQESLAGSSEVKSFIGDDKSFKVRQKDGGYVIERSDGTIWRIPSDSKAAETAKQLCEASAAQANASGTATTAAKSSGWTVTLDA